jgi:hypothetical protein
MGFNSGFKGLTITARRHPAAAGTRATPNLIELLTKRGGKVIGAFQKSKCSQI